MGEVSLALDWGKVRVGVASTDVTGTLSFPVDTFSPFPPAVDALFALIAERQPKVVYFGLPLALSGEEGPASEAMRAVASTVATRIAPIPVRLVDERLTSVVAHRALADAGRSSKRRRSVVDQAAAVAILEQAVEFERRTGQMPGELVEGGP